jgi:hypothetical protein
MDQRAQRLLMVEKTNDGKEEYFIYNPNETNDPQTQCFLIVRAMKNKDGKT